jgi:hypothetical protein
MRTVRSDNLQLIRIVSHAMSLGEVLAMQTTGAINARTADRFYRLWSWSAYRHRRRRRTSGQLRDGLWRHRATAPHRTYPSIVARHSLPAVLVSALRAC